MAGMELGTRARARASTKVHVSSMSNLQRQGLERRVGGEHKGGDKNEHEGEHESMSMTGKASRRMAHALGLSLNGQVERKTIMQGQKKKGGAT